MRGRAISSKVITCLSFSTTIPEIDCCKSNTASQKFQRQDILVVQEVHALEDPLKDHTGLSQTLLHPGAIPVSLQMDLSRHMTHKRSSRAMRQDKYQIFFAKTQDNSCSPNQQ